jgi:hypothetical protein
MIPNNYIGRDFASFDANKIKAYYGPNEIDQESEEFCFVLWKGGKEIFRRTNTELLNVAAQESPEAMLIAGLSLYLATK